MSDDTPIDPMNYLYGLKVVDIGDLRVARGKSRRPLSMCNHRNLTYDKDERRILCDDCKTEVQAFDAFLNLCEVWDRASRRLQEREKAMAELEGFKLISRAAKAIDAEWRKKSTVPCCPACNSGLLPEDFIKPRARISKQWATAERKRRLEKSK